MSEDLTTTINEMIDSGAAFKFNGADADSADLMTDLDELDAADKVMMNELLKSIQDEMGYRRLPGQFIPSGEGYLPTINIRVPGVHGQSWDAAATWNRDRR